MASTTTLTEVLALLARLNHEEEEYQREYERRVADIQRRRQAVETTLAMLREDAGADAPAAVTAPPQPPVLLPSRPAAGLAQQLRGLPQTEALRRIAEANGGLLRTSEARQLFIEARLTKGKLKNLGPHIYHMLASMDEFEKVEPGVYRLVKTSTSVTMPPLLPVARDW